MSVTDVTNLIERLGAFEERMGVRLESLGAKLEDMGGDSVFLTVSGELHPQSGTELPQDVELVIAAYDTSSKIVGTVSHRFESEGFFGFEIFEEMVQIHVNNLKRVRILPKRAD
jgi:hypothetical protein